VVAHRAEYRRRRRHVSALLAVAVLGAAGCGAFASDVDTGLEGVVRRGPVTPVCLPATPCIAGFAARFEVLRAGRRIATFNSNVDGTFQVRLRPGRVTIVPTADAPLVAPNGQRREVDVGPSGLTHVELDFDTGIR